ncbi:hypothetical protein ACO0QE_002665 [Hanseniaspora vineae]
MAQDIVSSSQQKDQQVAKIEKSFPGQGSSIPDRLVDSLSCQPLNMLIPKSDLVQLINPNTNSASKLSLRGLWNNKDSSFYSPYNNCLSSQNNFSLVDQNCLTDDKMSDQLCDELNDLKDEHFVFQVVNSNALPFQNKSSDENPETNLFEGLSKIAQDCISNLVAKDDIATVKMNEEPTPEKVESLKKHALNDEKENHDPEHHLKKVKITINSLSDSSNTLKTLVSETIDTKKLNDLTSLGETLTTIKQFKYEDSNIWIKILDQDGNESAYLTTPAFIDSIQMKLRNALSYLSDKNIFFQDAQNSNSVLSLENLQLLMNVCVANIEASPLTPLLQLEVKLKSIGIILAILSSGLIKDPKKNVSPHYLDKSLSLLSMMMQEIFENENYEVDFATLTIIQSTISSFLHTLNKSVFIDDSLVIKILYSFIDIIVNGNDFFKFSSETKFQACWDDIKTKTTQIYVCIFQNYPTQRDFIIDLFLPSFEKLPSTKATKKLFKVGKSNFFYMSYFTYNLLCLFQSAKVTTAQFKNSKDDEQLIDEILSNDQNRSLDLSNWCEQITEGVLKRVVGNYADLKNSFEIFCNDLIQCLSRPEWCAAEQLLTALTKKLLFVFSPTTQSNVQIESLALAQLSQIGSAMLNIKKTEDSVERLEDYSIAALCNYPKRVEKIITNFDIVKTHLLQNENENASDYLWGIELTLLINLRELKSDEASWNEKFTKYILDVANKKIFLTDNLKYAESEVDSCYTSITQSCSLLTLYEPYLKLVLSLIDSPKIRLRSGAVKCFSALIARDVSMIDVPMIQETIAKKLKDASASVKDSILDIIEQSPKIEQFYKEVNINYNDDSVAVRKHVLKLNKRIYETSGDPKIKGYVLSYILKKIEDEEDVIIDSAKSFLQNELFFKIGSLNNKPEKQESICSEIIRIISTMIKSSDKCNEMFYLFFNFSVLNERHFTAEEYTELLASVKILTKVIIAKILVLQQNDENTPKTKEDALRDLLGLLCVVASSDGSFVTREQLSTLYPFLTTTDDANTRLSIFKIFNFTLMKSSVSLRPKFLIEMETFILKSLPKLSNKETEEAIQLAWLITKERRDSQRVVKACFSCLKHLSFYIKIVAKDPTKVICDNKLQRLLHMSTGFARFCEIANDNGEHSDQLKPNENVYEYVTKCLLMFTKQNVDDSIRALAIRNMANLCSTRPKLFNSSHVLSVFDHVFEKESYQVKTMVLNSFYLFFTREEQKILKKAGVNGTVSSDLNFKQKMAGSNEKHEKFNDGVCSALVTRYLKQVLKLCLCEDPAVSTGAIKFLSMIDSYRYANPSHYIHCLIALLINQSAVCRKWTEKMILDVLNNFEAMVFSGLVSGLMCAIQYNKSLRIPVDENFLNKLQTIVGTTKSNRARIATSITKCFQMFFESREDKSELSYYGCLFLCYNLIKAQYEDKYSLYKLMKMIDVYIQKLDEQIEIFEDSDKDEIDIDTQFNTIMEQNILLEFRTCMFKNYVMNEDTLFIIGTDDENELKNTPVSVSTSPLSFDFGSVCYHFDPNSQKESIIEKFWTIRDSFSS